MTYTTVWLGVFAPSPVFAAAQAWGEGTSVMRAGSRLMRALRQRQNDLLWLGSEEADIRFELRTVGHLPTDIME